MPKNNEEEKVKTPMVPTNEDPKELETKEPETKESATMEVPVDKMEAIMERLDSLEKSNATLRELASSTRLQEVEEKQGEDKRPRVSFKLMDGKVVIGWPETVGDEKKNELIFNPATNTPMGESVKSVYYFHDGTKSDLIDQMKFTRITDIAFARVIKDDGDYGVVEFENKSISSEPIRIHKKFWNA